IFSLEELVAKFSIDRVHKGGAKFDYEKAKWFNQQYILTKSDEELARLIRPFIERQGVSPGDSYLAQVAGLIKERCHLLTDFWEHGHFFFKAPEQIELTAISEKWNATKKLFFETWLSEFENISAWQHHLLE